MNRYATLKYVLPAVAGYLCLYWLAIYYCDSSHPEVGYIAELIGPWFAVTCCVRRAVACPKSTKRAWAYVSIGMFLWSGGLSISVYESITTADYDNIASLADFLYLLYGALLLLACSRATQSEQLRLFDWLDSIQVLAGAGMIYLALFSVLPFLNADPRPVSLEFVVKVYNVENLFLAASGTVRLLAHRQHQETRRFYSTICIYLWTYAGCAAWYNHMVLSLQGTVGEYAILTVLPFLLLSIVCLCAPPSQPEAVDVPKKAVLAHFIDNASPVLYTLALVLLGFYIVREHYWAGVAAIVLALSAYAIRSTVLQTRFTRSQQDLREARDQLEKLSLTDGLTGVPNRRRFDSALDAEWSRAVRLGLPLSLLIVDVDHFKKLNDHYGHQKGDACLIDIARALSSAVVRSTDLLCRYGGEEFVAILVNTDRRSAETVAARMRSAVRAIEIPHELSDQRIVTVSIGVSTYEPPAEWPRAALVQTADRALYRAKMNGRDRVEFLLAEEAEVA